ncbi:putative ribonuclease H-like domain-containing protein [Tanacetum coccineum]
MQNGISAGYDEWTHHGESCDVSDDSDDDVSFNDEDVGSDNMNGDNDDDDADDDLDEMLDNIGQGTWGDKWKTNAESSSSIDKDLEYLGRLLDDSHQELYSGCQISNDMRWHKDVRVNNDNVATHPGDSEAWKHFDREFPSFTNDPRNGYNACPICMNETSSSYLSHSRKVCYMGHRRFLPSSHQWRNDKKNFDGTRETRKPIVPMSGLEVLHDIDCTISEPCCSVKKRKRKNLEGKKGWKKRAYSSSLSIGLN